MTKDKRHRDDHFGREYTEKMRAHLEAVRPKCGEKDFQNPHGRPTKKQLIQDYQKANPAATKYRCSKDLHIDYKTVSKWWEV